MAVYKVTVHSAPEPNQFVVSANNRKQAENTVKNHLCGFIESETLKAEDVFNLSSDMVRLDANFKEKKQENCDCPLSVCENKENVICAKKEIDMVMHDVHE